MSSLQLPFLRAAIAGSGLAVSIPAQAANFTWDGGGTDNLFGTAGNWVSDIYPGSPGAATINGHKIIFGTLAPGGQSSVNINVGGNPDGFEFSAGASAMTLSGTSAMQLATGNAIPIVNLSSETQTFTNTIRPFWIGGTTRTWNATNGDLVYAGMILRADTLAAAASVTQVFGGANDHTVNGTINLEPGTSWNGRLANLQKTGAGTLLLKSSGNYSGATTLTGGIIRIQNSNSLGLGTVSENQKTDIKAGAALEIDGSLAVSEFIRVAGTGVGGTGAIRAVSGTTNHNTQIAMEGTGGAVVSIGVDAGATLKVNRLYSDAGRDTNFEKVGAGTLVLKADDSDAYVGNTTITGGTLQVGDSGATGELKTTGVTNNATLTFNRTNTYAYTGDITGSGALRQNGSGTLVLGGNSTYTGSTTVAAGTLAVNGSLANTSGLTVDVGATLIGTGSVGGLTTVNGTFGPGNSIGEMTFGGGLALAGVSNFEIDPTMLLGLNGDLATVTAGSLTYGGVLNVTYGGPAADFSYGQAFNLFDWAAGSPLGSFSTVNLPTLADGLSWQNDLATSGSFTVVPEPSAAALAALGTAVLLRRRRTHG